MANTHLYSYGNSVTGWRKAIGLWVLVGGVWQPVKKQWIWWQGAWRLGYDPTPGTLVTVVITPSSANVGASQVVTFTASGRDADGFTVPINDGDGTWDLSGDGANLITGGSSISSTTNHSTDYTSPSAGNGSGIDTLAYTHTATGASASVQISFST